MFCRLYRAASRRWGPQGLTLSAFAFKHAQETGCVFWRVKVDAIFMLLTGAEQHCQTSYQRERRQEAVQKYSVICENSEARKCD